MKRLATIRLVWLVSGVLFTCLESSVLVTAADDPASPRVIVVGSSEPTPYEQCRRVVVGAADFRPTAPRRIEGRDVHASDLRKQLPEI